ncbi:MAG: enoyl-[acyl-carrier-protein] reductase FabK [Acutalibacteraceae bacterium]|nr:enoyl-[acyl-carrier-protein] reductase FabK [Acutalibacteraceae bacterium]
MISTPINELLNIKYPIFQGGMAWVADASLASAVSNAGGLGIIAAMNSNGEQLRAEIKKCKELTDKPFGVNIMLMSPFVEETAKVVAEEKIPVVTTGAGNPARFMEMWLDAGIKVIPVTPSVTLAKMAQKNGAFAVIAEGGESGGHVGDITTMALVPQICDAVDIPVIAAGGIGDGRGIAASFMLGAVGVQLGTRFLVAKECTISEEYKKKVLKAKDIDTVVTGKRLGHPVRSIKNSFTRNYTKCEYNCTEYPDDVLEQMGVGILRKAAREGDVSNGCVLAGQIAGMVKKEQTCKEMIDEMFAEAEQVLGGASKWVK